MCGILGYIGKPTDHKASFKLINSLMVKTESRGIDATGFWACHSTQNKVFYHKEPIKSSEFVNHNIWTDTAKQKLDLLLGHCRYTSRGVGQGRINKNNHPHVSKDCRVALVHNGYISEYPYLKKHYPVSTDCDSEVLLRIFESGEYYREQVGFLENNLQKARSNLSDMYRIYGLKQIFSEVSYGAMAVAIGERLSEGRSLWLFHNEHRPLCLIDLTKTMGQYFFCSTPELFRAATDDADLPKNLIPADQSVIQLPSDYVYHFHLEDDGKMEWEKFKVNRVRKYGCWEDDEQRESIPKGERLIRPAVEIVTNLDEDEDVIPIRRSVVFEELATVLPQPDLETENSAEGVAQLCCKGIDLLRLISTRVQNAVQEGSIRVEDIDRIADNLYDIVIDIDNTKHSLDFT